MGGAIFIRSGSLSLTDVNFDNNSATEAGGINNDILGSDASGDLNHTDIDNSDDVWQAVTNPTLGDNSYGSYTIDAAGNWTYIIDNSNATVEALNVGDSLNRYFYRRYRRWY